MRNVLNKIISEYDKTMAKIDAIDPYNMNRLSVIEKLLEYSNGLRFAIDVLEKEVHQID